MLALIGSGEAAGMTLISAELVVNGAVVQTATDLILIGKRVFVPVMRR